MSAWPVRPKGMDAHRWYRQIEKDLALTVISVDPVRCRCPECGGSGLIFHCQTSPDRQIISVCKECAVRRAGEPPKLWVRTDAGLRKKWARNGRDPARTAAATAALLLRQRGAGARSASPDDPGDPHP